MSNVQFKIGDPRAAAQKTAMVHDRIATGHEFALFQQLLHIASMQFEPVINKNDPFGRAEHYQEMRLLTPFEAVDRARRMTELALGVARERGWIITTADINEIFPDEIKTFEKVR